MTHDEVIAEMYSLIASGKVKTKGAYEVLPHEKLGWHKNHSAMVIPMAVLSELLGFEKSELFIRSHTDAFDFLMRTKVPRSSRLVTVDDDGNDIPQQNICRYYPAVGGGSLIKIMPPLVKGDPDRRLGIDTEWKVKTCNDIDSFDWDLNYDYYISAAQKLVDGVSLNAMEVSPF